MRLLRYRLTAPLPLEVHFPAGIFRVTFEGISGGGFGDVPCRHSLMFRKDGQVGHWEIQCREEHLTGKGVEVGANTLPGLVLARLVAEGNAELVREVGD